eukprot:scaffold5912_cov33-Tisochrysis_lutea.AAC.1
MPDFTTVARPTSRFAQHGPRIVVGAAHACSLHQTHQPQRLSSLKPPYRARKKSAGCEEVEDGVGPNKEWPDGAMEDIIVIDEPMWPPHTTLHRPSGQIYDLVRRGGDPAAAAQRARADAEDWPRGQW